MKNFTFSCFVRVDDINERDHLNKWMKDIGRDRVVHSKKNRSLIFTAYNTFQYEQNNSFHHSNEQDIKNGYIDCGTNIKLFKAFAAMNDTDDYMQWFIEDILVQSGIGGQTVGMEPKSKIGEKWFLYEEKDSKLSQHIKYELENSYYGYYNIHNATKEEIIKHFTK